MKTRFVISIATALMISATTLKSADAAVVVLGNAAATYSQSIPANPHFYDVAEAIDGTVTGNNGWAVGIGDGSDATAATAVFEIDSAVPYNGGTTLVFTFIHNFGGQQLLGNFRLSVTNTPGYTTDGLPTGANVAGVWAPLTITSVSSTNGVILDIVGPGQLLANPPPTPLTSVYTIVATTNLPNITGLRLEALADSTLPSDGPGLRPNGNFVLTELQVQAFPTLPEPASMVIWGVGAMGCFVVARFRKGCLEVAA